MRVRHRSGRSLAGLPHAQGKRELSLDLVRVGHVEGVRSMQCLGDEFEPHGMALIQQAASRGPRGRAAQFGLGQQPQMGFRGSARNVVLLPGSFAGLAGQQITGDEGVLAGGGV